MDQLFFKQNRKKYFDLMDSNSFTVLFSGRKVQSTNDQDYPFEVNRNFYYLTGIKQDNVSLVLVKSESSNNAYLFIEDNDPVLVKWIGKKLEEDEAVSISGIENVLSLNQFDNFIFNLLNPSRTNNLSIDKVYLDLERRPDDGFTTMGIEFANKLSEKYRYLQVLNCYPKLIELRMFKTEEEIKLIKASIETTKGGIEALMNNAKANIFEYQLEAYFDLYLKQHENKQVSFQTIAATGKNATVLHYTANNTLIHDQDLILFDLGCKTDLYISDISRTFPISGKFTPRQKAIYNAVLHVNKECIKFLKPGETWKSYNEYASSLLAEELIKLGLIKEKAELRKYYWHSIGHNIGLDTHDPGLSNVVFKKGMVMTVEPGIYVEEEGIGVRIEDNVLITDDGCINLSSDIIKEVDEIEKFMNR